MQRHDDGFAAKRPYTRKPAGDFGASRGDSESVPSAALPPSTGRARERKTRQVSRRKPAGDFAKREGGYTKRSKREEASAAPQKKRGTSKAGGFGFTKFSKPKFVKPSKHRDLGSDKTENFERKPFSGDRPYSKDRPADRGFAKKPGGFTGDRKFSKGPGKPSGYAPRSGGDFKPRSSGSGDFKRPAAISNAPAAVISARTARTGSFGKSSCADRPRTSTGGAAAVRQQARLRCKTRLALLRPRRQRRHASSFGSASRRQRTGPALGSAPPSS